MTARATVRIAILALLAVALLWTVNRHQREPVSRNRPLSYWMGRLDNRSDSTARTAIKEMGANALPELRGVLQRDDSPLRKHIAAWLSGHPWLKAKLNLRPAAEVRRAHALDAVTCLGPDAKPALPGILPFVTNQSSQLRIRALFALKSIGPDLQRVRPVVPSLIQALGGGEWTMRVASLGALEALKPPPPEAVPAVLKLANDSNEMVRAGAIHYLVAQTNAIVIPLLDKQLHDQDSYTITAAASQIGVFGAAASASAPRLRQLLDNPVLTVRQAASNALLGITGQIDFRSAPKEKAALEFNFQGTPFDSVLSVYESLAGKKVTMKAAPNPSYALLRVLTVHPLTTNEALQLLDEVLKEQAGLVVVHGQDGSLTALAKP